MLQQLLNPKRANSWLFWLGSLLFCASCGFAPTPVAIYENEFFALDSLHKYDAESAIFVYKGIFWNKTYNTPKCLKKNQYDEHNLVVNNEMDTIHPRKCFERLVLLNDSTYFYGASWDESWIAKGRWKHNPEKKLLHFEATTEYISPDSCAFFEDIAYTFVIKEKYNHKRPTFNMPQHLKYALNLQNLSLLGEMEIHWGVYTFDLPTSTKEIQFIHPARNLQRTFSVWE